MYTILAINPGSTSTKVAIYQDDKAVRELTLRHSTEELAPFAGVLDQFDFRKQIILDAMKEAGVTLSDIDAVIGRGGLIKPVKSGVYEVNETMIDDIRHRPVGQHASNLGALLAYDIAREAGAKAYMADPVVVDELQDVARITGHPDIERVSIFHALNQKAMARAYAEKRGVRYEDLNLIVVHLGGGISVGAHRKGEVIDVNNALGYDATSIEEITATVGVAKGTLYYHFSSKEEIFNFLVEEGVKLLKNSIAIKTDKLSNSLDKIRAIVLIQIKILVKYENFMTIILSQIWGNDARSIMCRNHVFEYIQMIEEIVKKGMEQKEILDGDANIIASGIFGFTCSSLIYKMRHNKDGIDIQKLYKEIDKSFIKKLKKV